MDKDRVIITQVCAKIAAELVDTSKSTEEKIGEYAILFQSVKDLVFDVIESAPTTVAPIIQLQNSFQGSTVVDNGLDTGALEIVGKQHGDIPEWLITACRRDGVSKVYDNRDGLAVNAKRPWFKSVVGEKAYWAPKPRR